MTQLGRPATFMVEDLTATETLSLRQSVLWPTLARDACYLPGDEKARHFGLREEGRVMCCLSVFDLNDGCVQIRKFATASTHQRKGFGRYLLNHVLDLMRTKGVKSAVLDARVTATALYAKHGFETVSEPFEKRGITHVRMERRL